MFLEGHNEGHDLTAWEPPQASVAAGQLIKALSVAAAAAAGHLQATEGLPLTCGHCSKPNCRARTCSALVSFAVGWGIGASGIEATACCPPRASTMCLHSRQVLGASCQAMGQPVHHCSHARLSCASAKGTGSWEWSPKTTGVEWSAVTQRVYRLCVAGCPATAAAKPLACRSAAAPECGCEAQPPRWSAAAAGLAQARRLMSWPTILSIASR